MHRTARLATIRTLLDVPAPDVDVSPINYRARYRYRLTTSWAILSATVGIPNGRVSVLLSPFGMSTRLTGSGKWAWSTAGSFIRLQRRPASCPGTVHRLAEPR